MMLQHFALPGGGVDMGVDFGGCDVFVAKHFLDDTKVGSVLYQMSGEGVAEGVRRDFLRHAGKKRVFSDEFEH